MLSPTGGGVCHGLKTWLMQVRKILKPLCLLGFTESLPSKLHRSVDEDGLERP